MLARGDREDVNLEGVLRHSLADALGSIAVVASGAVILATGWLEADPIASLAVAALILLASVRLIREPLNVLMESAPAGLDVEELGRALVEVDGVREVHELHVWTVTSGFVALSAHVVIEPDRDRDLARRELEYLLRERYGIAHTTLQMEEAADEGALLQVGPARAEHLGTGRLQAPLQTASEMLRNACKYPHRWYPGAHFAVPARGRNRAGPREYEERGRRRSACRRDDLQRQAKTDVTPRARARRRRRRSRRRAAPRPRRTSRPSARPNRRSSRR